MCHVSWFIYTCIYAQYINSNPDCKPLSGGSRDQNIPQCPFYPAGFSGYITLSAPNTSPLPNANMKEDDDFEDGLDLLVPGAKERTRVLFRIGEELKKESDRGCALVAAAYLENQTSDLLERLFVEQGVKAQEALFDFNGPVGTFSSKIKMAYALGLIPQEIQNALDLVRKIRNEFAHLHEPLDFETSNIKQRVASLLPSVQNQHESTRQIFIGKIQSMAATIHLCISHIHKKRAPEYEQVPLRDDPSEQEIEIAARRMMRITAPDITYDQAIEMAKRIRDIK